MQPESWKILFRNLTASSRHETPKPDSFSTVRVTMVFLLLLYLKPVSGFKCRTAEFFIVLKTPSVRLPVDFGSSSCGNTGNFVQCGGWFFPFYGKPHWPKAPQNRNRFVSANQARCRFSPGNRCFLAIHFWPWQEVYCRKKRFLRWKSNVSWEWNNSA